MNRSSKGQSNIISEVLLIGIVIILATALVLGLNSSVSYYLERRELANVYVFAMNRGNWVNFTTIHSGGDAVRVSGQIYVRFDNGTSNRLDALLIYGGSKSLISGGFQISSFKFGDNFQVCVDVAGLNNCTIYYVLSSRSQILVEVDKKI